MNIEFALPIKDSPILRRFLIKNSYVIKYQRHKKKKEIYFKTRGAANLSFYGIYVKFEDKAGVNVNIGWWGVGTPLCP